MKFNSSFKQKGVSMVEMVIYVALGLLIVTGGFVSYQIASGYFNTTQLASGIQTMRNGIVNLYSSNKDYSSLNNGVLVSARIIPDGVSASGSGATTTLLGGWGGAVNVYGEATAGGAAKTTPPSQYYGLQVTKVPYDQCVKAVSQVGNMTAAGWDSIILTPDAGSNGTATTFTPATTPNVDAGQATTACGSTGTTTIVFSSH